MHSRPGVIEAITRFFYWVAQRRTRVGPLSHDWFSKKGLTPSTLADNTRHPI